MKAFIKCLLVCQSIYVLLVCIISSNSDNPVSWVPSSSPFDGQGNKRPDLLLLVSQLGSENARIQTQIRLQHAFSCCPTQNVFLQWTRWGLLRALWRMAGLETYCEEGDSRRPPAISRHSLFLQHPMRAHGAWKWLSLLSRDQFVHSLEFQDVSEENHKLFINA